MRSDATWLGRAVGDREMISVAAHRILKAVRAAHGEDYATADPELREACLWLEAVFVTVDPNAHRWVKPADPEASATEIEGD